jgi:hypothetical protein
VVVIGWELDLQLPVQSVPITTEVVSLNPAHGKVHLIQNYVIQQVGGFLRVLWFPPTEHHDITEILLKVALNIIS